MRKSTPIKQSKINYDCLTNLRNRARTYAATMRNK